MKKNYWILFLFVVDYAFAQEEKQVPYVILISFDGFRYDYVSAFNLTNFNDFISKGAAAEALIPSFPSKTFPNHYTLVTGLYPGHHGLVDNQFYDPVQKKHYGVKDRNTVRDPSFYGGTPLWLLTQQHGMRSASFFWVGSETPIQGAYPDYYFKYDESVSEQKEMDQTIAWLKLPEKDRPHFISLYFSLVDREGHWSGTNSKGLQQTVMKTDSLLGDLMTKLKGIDLPVNVIIVSDHGMMELKQQPESYVTLSDLFNIADTSVVIENGGTQAHIYSHAADSLYVLLKKKEQNFKVYKRENFPARWHYDHSRSGDLLIVADPGYYIQVVGQSFGKKNLQPVFGAHGFDPYIVSEMRGIFYACGPNIKQGIKLKAIDNIHVYPLIAKILGLKTAVIDGDIKVLEPIYKKLNE